MTDPATPDPTTPDPAAPEPTSAAESAPAADATAAPESTSAADSTPAADAPVTPESTSPADSPATADSAATADAPPPADSPPADSAAWDAEDAADPASPADPAGAPDSTPAADSAPVSEPPASTPGPAARQSPADAPSTAQNGAAQNGSRRPAQADPWATASAESAADRATSVPGPESPEAEPAGPPVQAGAGIGTGRPESGPRPSAGERAASGTGWPEPASAERASGTGPGAAAGPEQPAAGADGLTGKVSPASGRRPGDRRATGSSDAWSAVTDPIGTSGQRSAEAAGPKDGAESRDAAASRAPAPRWDAGPAAERDKTRSVPARRPAPRRPETRRPGSPGSDLLGDLQRWLIRSGTKSVRREVEGQVRRTLGGGRRAESADAWGTATTEPPPHLGESPECAWCPICRAARRMRESGPGLGSQLSGASDAVASAVQDAIVAVDAIFSRPASAPGPRRPADESAESGHPDSADDPAERVPDEPGDRG